MIARIKAALEGSGRNGFKMEEAIIAAALIALFVIFSILGIRSQSDIAKNQTDRAHAAEQSLAAPSAGGDVQEKHTPFSGLSVKNGQMLEVCWDMPEGEAAPSGLELQILDRQTSQVLMEISTDHVSDQSDKKVSAEVRRFSYLEENTRVEKRKNCPFLCYSKEGVGHFVLDTLDVAAPEPGEEYDGELLGKSLSFQRFGLSTDRIFIRARKAGGAWQDAGEADVLFGGQNEAGANQIANARHLFNLRYMEGASMENTAKIRHYLQTKNINWQTQEIYAGTDAVRPSQTPFVPTAVLQSGSVYDGQGNKISGLLLKPVVQNRTAEDKLGLFRENYGTIQNLVFVKAEVSGRDDASDTLVNHVGTACGCNYGRISGVELKGGSVAGGMYVGGITGISGDEQYDKTSVSGCIGRARVQGELFVGGIVGWNEKGPIDGCSYAFKYEDYDTEDWIADIKSRKLLTGSFVGGIVGYNKSGHILACETTDGYVLGEEYVGGIVGYQETGVLGASTADDVSAAPITNRAHILAQRYAGGIAGAVGSHDGDAIRADFSITEPEDMASAGILNAVNEGLVTATESYGGGICGYNTGTLKSCVSRLDTSKMHPDQAKAVLDSWGAGDCIGGIAGYNAGIIAGSQSAADALYVVSGRNYVGGVAGISANREADDTAADIQGSAGAGTYVYAKNFAGGLAGLNTNPTVLNGRSLSAQGIVVQAGSFAGGVFGANILSVSDSDKLKVTAQGSPVPTGIWAERLCAGGFSGYLRLVESYYSDQNALDAADELLSLDDMEADEAAGALSEIWGICGAKIKLTRGGGGAEVSSPYYAETFIGYTESGTDLTYAG